MEAHHEPLPSVAFDGVDTPQTITVWEVGVRKDVVPLSNSTKVQKLVQQLKNHSNMQVCPFMPEIQQTSLSKDIEQSFFLC